MTFWRRLFETVPRHQLPHQAVGHLYAVRVWRIYGEDQPVLMSRFRTAIWPGGSAMRAESKTADCQRGEDYLHKVPFKPHAAPARDCTCGLYAGKPLWARLDLDAAEEIQRNRSIFWGSPKTYLDLDLEYSGKTPLIAGIVALWGRIIQHTLGYRAEYAYPVALVYHDAIKHAEPHLTKVYNTRSVFTTKDEYLTALDELSRAYVQPTTNDSTRSSTL